MSMFGYGTTKEQIYQELKWIYESEYKDQWDSSEYQLKFTMDVMDVLRSLFGDW